jgi:hypothetical protein
VLMPAVGESTGLGAGATALGLPLPYPLDDFPFDEAPDATSSPLSSARLDR